MPPGTATVFFKTTEKNSRIPVDLVNDGFGVNQIIYLLSKILRVDVDTLLVEEPEIHLHPTIIRKFVRVLHTLVHDEGKQILLTTHSEQLLISLLALVSEGTARPDDLRFYLTTKDRRTTVFKKQSIKSNGQVEGGLSSFVEAELDDLMRFLGGKPK
jgi:predicted ATPase